MNMETIAAYLESNGCGKRMKSIYVHEMPAECKDGILLIGNYYGTPINHELRGYVETEFRLAVRATDMVKGMALAKKASDALTIYSERIYADVLFKQVLPLNEPRPYRRSAGAFWEFEVDVSIRYCAA